MEKSYEETTIDDLITLYMTDFTAEIKCDADKKTLSIISLGIAMENLKKAFLDVIEPIAKPLLEMVQIIANGFAETTKLIADTLKPLMMHQKLSKKKFMKLLQSEGIQRNEINKIVANNKEPYTYMRLYQTLDEYRKR